MENKLRSGNNMGYRTIYKYHMCLKLASIINHVSKLNYRKTDNLSLNKKHASNAANFKKFRSVLRYLINMIGTRFFMTILEKKEGIENSIFFI